MDRQFKHKVNKTFESWKFTKDGRFTNMKPGKKYKKMRRKNQRSLEKNQLRRELQFPYE